MGSDNSTCVGIDDIAIHFPRLYMDMKDFADLRGEDYGKLNKGRTRWRKANCNLYCRYVDSTVF